MKRHRLSCGSRYNQGFSLIELMVSLVIGLIISVAAFSAYLGASKAARMAEAQGRMNEDAQAALTILTHHIRMAGNNPKQANRIDNSTPELSRLRNPVYLPTPTNADISPNSFTLSGFTIRGCDGTFNRITTTTSLDNLTCTGGTSTLPDSIAISYEADIFNTVPSANDVPTDCLGRRLTNITAKFNAIPANTTTTPATSAIPAEGAPYSYYVADNRFYIGTSATILSPSLYCKGNGGNSATQPLVENIEDMQFTYGTVKPLTPPNLVNTATVAGYLSADEFSLRMPSLSDAKRWANVVTVRICVVVRSEIPVAMDANSAKYRNCEDVLVSAPDLRMRRAYTTTVVLRNRRLYEPPLTPPP